MSRKNIHVKGYRRNNSSNTWSALPTTEPIQVPESLLNTKGLCFPMFYNGESYEIPMNILGVALPVVLSSTHRSLSISSSDSGKFNMDAEEEDLICTLQHKKSQLYCGSVLFTKEQQHTIVCIPKYDFYLSEGTFQSRLGLLPKKYGRSIYNQLKMKHSTMCINFVSSTLAIGYPMHKEISQCPLQSAKNDNNKLLKNVLRMNITRISMNEKILCQGMVGIIHLETPYFALPKRMYDAFMEHIHTKSTLFKDSAFEEEKDVIAHIDSFPTFFVNVAKENGKDYILEISTSQYLFKKDKLIYLKVVPVEEKNFVVLGNCTFKNTIVTVDFDSNKIWIVYGLFKAHA